MSRGTSDDNIPEFNINDLSGKQPSKNTTKTRPTHIINGHHNKTKNNNNNDNTIVDTDTNIVPVKTLPKSKLETTKIQLHHHYRKQIVSILNRFPFIKKKHSNEYNRVLKYIGADVDYHKAAFKNQQQRGGDISKYSFDIASAILKRLLTVHVNNQTKATCLQNVKKIKSKIATLKFNEMDRYNNEYKHLTT